MYSMRVEQEAVSHMVLRWVWMEKLTEIDNWRVKKLYEDKMEGK